MRAVVTRVTEASVTIDGAEYSRIGRGFLVLLGVHVSDTAAEADRIVDRICGLRVFEDANGKMNVNPADAGAELLIVSQFTLFADCRSRRPGFTAAARPETAVPLWPAPKASLSLSWRRGKPLSPPARRRVGNSCRRPVRSLCA